MLIALENTPAIPVVLLNTVCTYSLATVPGLTAVAPEGFDVVIEAPMAYPLCTFSGLVAPAVRDSKRHRNKPLDDQHDMR